MTTLNTRISDLAKKIGGDMKLVVSRLGTLEVTQFSGKYKDLTGAPTKLSQFIDDVGVSTGGVASTAIKTFNIVGRFWAPVAGTASFYPLSQTILRSVQLVNGEVARQDLMVGLYQNGALIQFFTLPAGQQQIIINTDNNVTLYAGDNMTVSVVAGSGLNFNMQLLSVNH